MRYKPDHIEWEQISFVPRAVGPFEDQLVVIFKCKKCHTIFNNKTFSEVIRFVDTVVTDEEFWPRLCLITDDRVDHVDKYGCSVESYKNASGNFENYIRDNLNFT